MTQWDKFNSNVGQGTVTPSIGTEINSIEEKDPTKAIVRQYNYYGNVSLNITNEVHSNSHNSTFDISSITLGELRNHIEKLPEGNEKNNLMQSIISISENPTIAGIISGVTSAVTTTITR